MSKEREEAINLRALMRTDKARARAQVIKAIEQTEGNATRAAALLGISHTTMRTYMQDPAIKAALDRVRGTQVAS